MIPKQAIEKAIGGGWFPSDDINTHTIDGGKRVRKTIEHICEEIRLEGLSYKIALDPSFWKALGKALEWSEEHFTSCAIWKTGECDCSAKDEWKEKAKEFYDLILERKDTTAFWEEILK